MEANPFLLQKKYARVVVKFAQYIGINMRESLDFFYHSITYKDMSEGVSDMHCRSDEYLVQELNDEYKKAKQKNSITNS